MAMAAGLAQLKVLERGGVYEKLEATGLAVEAIFVEELRKAGLRYPWVRIGSMFCLFFREEGGSVRNLTDAKTCSREGYAKFFHTLLNCGVYFPPSQYESCFISSMHDAVDLEITQRAVAQALRGKA